MNDLIGVIDLGSNTARLVVYEHEGQGIVNEIDNIKRVLRLSEHLKDGRLAEEGVASTITCMRQFKELLDARGAQQMYGVATAAVRQAANGAELLEAIWTQTGIRLRILSGEEEARYGYLAVMNSMDLDEGITIDIGGGSTEITYFRNRVLLESVSFPFGVVSLTRSFLQEDGTPPEELERLMEYLSSQMAACPWLSDKRCPVIAIGGTARNLAKIHQQFVQYSMRSLHHYGMTADQVGGILELLAPLSLEARRQVPGISKDRADVIVAGIAVLSGLMAHAQSGKLLVSDNGIRDGVLYDRILEGGRSIPPVPEVRRRSVEQFMRRYRINPVHARHVRELTLSLFDQSRALKLHAYGEEERGLLAAAALLNRAGKAINVHESSEHTFYLLSHVLMLGYNHRERLIIAMIAGYKNNRLLQHHAVRHADILRKEDKALAEQLGALILLARTLDRSMSQQVKAVHLRESKKAIVLACYGTRDNLMEYALIDDSLQKMAKAFKRPIKIETLSAQALETMQFT